MITLKELKDNEGITQVKYRNQDLCNQHFKNRDRKKYPQCPFCYTYQRRGRLRAFTNIYRCIHCRRELPNSVKMERLLDFLTTREKFEDYIYFSQIDDTWNKINIDNWFSEIEDTVTNVSNYIKLRNACKIYVY